MVLGVYFAMNSGTVDSVVYDAVIEETGSSDLYEMWIGRVRIVEARPSQPAQSLVACSRAGHHRG